jgi:hypothetical protein
MASVCGVPIKGRVLRVIQLDVCGLPITGASGRVITANSFTKVTMTPQYEDGTEFFERTADGSICVNQKDAPILKRMQLDVDLCAVDPDYTPLILSARELTTTAPVSGYGFAIQEGAPSSHFSLEVWQLVGGSGACSAGGLQYFIYNCFPHCYNARLQAYSMENAKSVLSFQCDTQAANPNWGHGPGSGADSTKWLPLGAGGNSGSLDHWLWNITTVTPPTPQCGFTTLT